MFFFLSCDASFGGKAIRAPIEFVIKVVPGLVCIISVAIAFYRELIGGILLIAEGLLCLIVLLVLPPSVLRNNPGIFYLWPWVLLLFPGIIFLASWLAGRK